MEQVSDFLQYVVTSNLQTKSMHDLKTARANIIDSGRSITEDGRLELARLQYWIMVKDGRIGSRD